MNLDEENVSDSSATMNSGLAAMPLMENYMETKRLLVEIPSKLIEEMKILGRHTCYVLYAEKPSSVMRVDGYIRISQDFNSLSYNVNEIKRLARAGYIPVLVLQCADQTLPTSKQVFTWWTTDHALKYPVSHGLLSVDKGRVELKLYNLKECFFCEKKSEALKNLEFTTNLREKHSDVV